MSEQPKSPRPKKIKDKENALKHGVYSREPMLPGEQIADYEALAAEVNEEWTPDGPTERGLADRLTDLYWRKQRLERYNHLVLEGRVRAVDGQNALNFQLSILKDLGTRFSAADSVETVEKILSGIEEVYRLTIIGLVPRESCKDPAKWGQTIAARLLELKPQTQIEGSAKFIAILDVALIGEGIVSCRPNRRGDRSDNQASDAGENGKTAFSEYAEEREV